MVLSLALLALAYLISAALGALPISGAPYRIYNVGSSLVFDIQDGDPYAGNIIKAYRVNDIFPGPQAQRIAVEQTGIVLGMPSVGLFRFSFPILGVGAYMKGPAIAGLGLNIQNVSTVFAVTDLYPGEGVFTITFPFSTFAITSPDDPNNRPQLTLRTLNPGEPRQQWKFIPA